MIPVLEAVPNLSTTDPDILDEAVRRVERAGAHLLDLSSDPDHGRSVLTLVGSPTGVAEAGVRLAELACLRIDLREHRGVHPRVGALDVLPFVPLEGMTLDDARQVAREVGERIAGEVGVPVWFYARASDPPGRGLAEIRRGGVEALVEALPPGRAPDLLPPGWSAPALHPTAGGVCVGARPLLLAWNVDVEGLSMEVLRGLAARLRATGGGPEGLRVLALELPAQGRRQLSMNLEDAGSRDPFRVFRQLEGAVAGVGGKVVRTEIIGLAPDALLHAAGADRLRTLDRTPPPALSSLLARHLSRRAHQAATRAAAHLRGIPEPHPVGVREALAILEQELLTLPDGNPAE